MYTEFSVHKKGLCNDNQSPEERTPETLCASDIPQTVNSIENYCSVMN